MTSLPSTMFSEKFIEISGESVAFRPHAVHDKDGDCVEFLAKPDPFYGERVDDLVTVYRSHENDEIVGALIKGVKGFCQKLLTKYPGFEIEIQDGKLRLACLFRAHAWATPKDDNQVLRITYRKLIAAAEESDAEMELCGLGT